MGGVAEQRRSTERPPGHRIAVDHREEEGAGRGPDDRRHVEPPERPVLERGQEVGQLTGAVPVLGRTELRLRATQLGDEVERLPAVGEVGDRVAHELLVPVAGPDHRATVEHRLDLGDPTPEQRAVPPRSDPRPGTAGRARCCGCRRPRPRHRPPRRARPSPGRASNTAPARSASASTVSRRWPRWRCSRPTRVDERVQQHLLQRAAVDRELRPRVAGGDTAWLPPDLPTVTRAVHEAGRLDRAAAQWRQDAERVELAHRVREQVDPDAEGLKARGPARTRRRAYRSRAR